MKTVTGWAGSAAARTGVPERRALLDERVVPVLDNFSIMHTTAREQLAGFAEQLHKVLDVIDSE